MYYFVIGWKNEMSACEISIFLFYWNLFGLQTIRDVNCHMYFIYICIICFHILYRYICNLYIIVCDYVCIPHTMYILYFVSYSVFHFPEHRRPRLSLTTKINGDCNLLFKLEINGIGGGGERGTKINGSIFFQKQRNGELEKS